MQGNRAGFDGGFLHMQPAIAVAGTATSFSIQARITISDSVSTARNERVGDSPRFPAATPASLSTYLM
jgi:hypothetical protein